MPGFSDEELEQMCGAYAQGASGSLLIGMRGQERLLTFYLPVTSTDAVRQLREQAKRLHSYGCDGWLYARAVLLEKEGQSDVLALLADESCLRQQDERRREQKLIVVQNQTQQWCCTDYSLLNDDLSQAVAEAFTTT